MERNVLHPGKQGSQRGLVVHTHTDYFSPLSYPAVAELGLRVNVVGKSSATYEIGIFEQDVSEVKAVAEFVHVYVDSGTGRPAAGGMGSCLREALSSILGTRRQSKI